MEDALKNKQIDWLLHFTQASNLPNIFRYGLLPKTNLLKKGISVNINDQYRYDDCEDAVCMSIEFPNYKMFYRLRMENRGIDWAVLLLDASILLDFECAFCVTNAGSSESYSIPLDQRMGKKAFLRLFEELPNGPSRKELNIRDWYPTNPQAEILVFDKIPISYISKVFFNNRQTLDEYLDVIPDGVKPMVKSKAFSYRCDWQYW